jgi:hypothetical protein
LFQGFKLADGFFRMFHQEGFGKFQFDVRRGQAVFLDGCRQLVFKAFLEELPDGDIDAFEPVQVQEEDGESEFR